MNERNSRNEKRTRKRWEEGERQKGGGREGSDKEKKKNKKKLENGLFFFCVFSERANGKQDFRFQKLCDFSFSEREDEGMKKVKDG